MNSLFSRKPIRIFLISLFVIIMGMTVLLHQYSNRQPTPTNMQGVVASDTISGDIIKSEQSKLQQ